MKDFRYSIRKDESGHNYLLPEHLWSLWDEITDNQDKGIRECWEDKRWESIENFSFDGGVERLIFTNPENYQ